MESTQEKLDKLFEHIKNKNDEVSLSLLSKETKIGYYLMRYNLIPVLVRKKLVEIVQKGAYQYVKIKEKND